jgi:phosphoribosylformimino-5-aminoimidazole carboxamide ribonucleotide (ProFAR) isomerase
MAQKSVGAKQLFLFKNYVEHIPKEKLKEVVPALVRGVYVLFKEDIDTKKMNVVYIGRATEGKKQGVGARLDYHKRDDNKKEEWSHFSVFEVWQNVSNDIIVELEALILHIYSRDGTANKLNLQKNSKLFRGVRRASQNEWKYRDNP